MAGILESTLPTASTVDWFRGLKGSIGEDSVKIAVADAADQIGEVMTVIMPDGTTGLLGDLLQQIRTEGATGLTGVATYAALISITPAPAAGTLVQVGNDPDPNKNGTYRRDASGPNGWVLTADKYAQLQIQVNAIDPAKYWTTFNHTAAWVTIGSPATRFTITNDDSGFRVQGLVGLSSTWQVGFRLPYAMAPGDVYEMEAVYASGTLSTTAGPWFGTDPVTSGDLSSSRRTVPWRNVPNFMGPAVVNATGVQIDVAYTTAPNLANDANPFVNGDRLRMKWYVRADGSVVTTVFVNDVPSRSPHTITPALPAGNLIIGVNINPDTDVKITKFTKVGYTGNTVFVDSATAVAGNGSYAWPAKTLYDVPKCISLLGLGGKTIKVQIVSTTVKGSMMLEDTVSYDWTVIGIPGGCTTVDCGEVRNDYTLEGGSTRVYSAPSYNHGRLGNVANQAFWVGQAINPQPWFTLPDTPAAALPNTTTVAALDAITTGGYFASGGKNYYRTPNTMAANPFTAGVVVAMSSYVIEVVGAPRITLWNLKLKHASQHVFKGAQGGGTINNCGAEWSGLAGGGNNGWEDENGSYVYNNCWAKYIANDGFARSVKPGFISSNGGVTKTVLNNCESSHTYMGDGSSQHEDATLLNRNRLEVNGGYFHDCYKGGIITQADVFMLGVVIERCGAQCFGIVAGTLLATARTYTARATDCTFDPQGGDPALSSSVCTCVDSLGLGGAKIDLVLDRCTFGIPGPAGGVEVRSTALVAGSGPTSPVVIGDTVTKLRACKSVRASPVYSDGGTSTITKVTTYDMV
jgi:hypothetical protein